MIVAFLKIKIESSSSIDSTLNEITVKKKNLHSLLTFIILNRCNKILVLMVRVTTMST